jgi:Calcineurin-like phosphoesterase
VRRVTALGLAVAAFAGCGSDAAPPPAPRGEVWAVGDGAARTNASRRVASMVRRAHPDLLLYLGDVYPSGRAVDFRRAYDPLYGELGHRTLPTPGNHDWPNARDGYLPYWRHVRGRPIPSFYATHARGWRILSLNSELGGGAMGRQVRWLRQQVAGGGNCRLVFWHEPRFSAGPHGDAERLDPLWRAVEGRAALVLSGHDHDMEQLRPKGGTTQLVAGSGGESHYSLRRDSRLLFGNNTAFGALRLRLRPGRASFAFVSSGGRVLHRGAVRCGPAT